MNVVYYTLHLLFFAPGELVVALACWALVVSCILLLNHMKAGWTHAPEKFMIAWIAIGAFGGAVGPLCGVFVQPTWAEVMLYTGAAAFSIWLTWPYWRELPALDRRSASRARVASIEEADYDRRVA